jgi:hypothetical protein
MCCSLLAAARNTLLRDAVIHEEIKQPGLWLLRCPASAAVAAGGAAA